MAAVRIDRDDVLARTDLPGLLDALSGPTARPGPGAPWRCPDPGHPDEHPSVTVFTDHRGIQRWRCWSRGHGGTAIDALVAARSVTVREALEDLAGRDGSLAVATVVPLPVAERRSPPLDRAVVDYVAACEEILWTDAGRPVLDWLVKERGLSAEVLRVNRVGADPGPSVLRRPFGLPRGGVAAVFPALDERGAVTYAQARYLDPPDGRSKYDNPAARLGENPRFGIVTPARSARRSELYVCEGMPDAYTAASAGISAVAILGATHPDESVARRITMLAWGRSAVIAFDNDPAGNAGAASMADLLGSYHVSCDRSVLPIGVDLNAAVRSGEVSLTSVVSNAPHPALEVPLPVWR